MVSKPIIGHVFDLALNLFYIFRTIKTYMNETLQQLYDDCFIVFPIGMFFPEKTGQESSF
ncbi:MAG: hypothetical protein CMH48_05935 [Muricauda sp.]|nr:hypothetical protein [Allomuricauda sp.]